MQLSPRATHIFFASILAQVLIITSSSFAGEGILHSFTGGADGGNPQAALVADRAGNLYGVTSGPINDGTVFEVSPPAAGTLDWTESVIYSFGPGLTNPSGSLILDRQGNLYGVALAGGAHGFGAVYELSPPSQGGTWSISVLYSFQNQGDGFYPVGALAFDDNGNLYGTTRGNQTPPCKTGTCGTVFELSRATGGGWTETTLYTFGGPPTDGATPLSGVVFHGGNVYGTTTFGGSGTYNACGTMGCGTVFELSPATGVGWTEAVLHNFNGSDGTFADAHLTFDKSGNLYGTTAGGDNFGAFAVGVVYELSPPPAQGGEWTATVLKNFSTQGSGTNPVGGLVMDSAGNLYGAATYGINYTRHCNVGGCGGLFQLAPDGAGGFTENVIHGFYGGKDGDFPLAGIVIGRRGKLFGTTAVGGTSNLGTVFIVAP